MDLILMTLIAYLSILKNAATAEASSNTNKIIIYAGERFTGGSVELNNNTPNLNIQGKISSLKVIGAPWVAYYSENYTGKQRLYEEGEYPTLERQFSSFRMITEDLENPEIQLFEHWNYKGRSVILKDEKNLQRVDFSDEASSHIVKSGVWVLYEHVNRQGKQLVCFPGQEVPNYCEIGFNDVISHARPLKGKE